VLEDVDAWFEMLEDRNRTSHTYSAKTADEVFESATRLPSLLRAALAEVRRRYLSAAA
jgi:hypothetical protein